MLDSVARALETVLTDRFCVGQVLVQKNRNGFLLSHRDDDGRDGLQMLRSIDETLEVAKQDEAGIYRPLKTAPNLRRGWCLEVVDLTELGHALDYFYPGRLAIFAAWKENRLVTTALRATLGRQSGMYRVAAKISDEQLEDVVAHLCRSDGGCLRTILWKRDVGGAIPSARLPKEKFDPAYDQAAAGNQQSAPADTVPLLCQEACSLLVAECRKAVKSE
jgi:hypothetical protein